VVGDGGGKATTISITVKPTHTGHTPFSAVDMTKLPPHPEIKQQIQELAKAHLPTGHIRDVLYRFAEQYMAEQKIKTGRGDKRFFPLTHTISNIRHAVLMGDRLCAFDQDSCEAYIRQRQAEDKDGHYHFQRSGPDTPMLAIMQPAEGARMLEMYGDTIVDIDATYKTNKWGFPMFMLCVVTNHGHAYPAAVFFTEDETSDTICAALRMIKTWNPGWSPKHVMMDKSDAEQNAVQEVLPTAKVLLCDFHRLQAWWRWINLNGNGVPNDK
jgi:MULE transposase domain